MSYGGVSKVLKKNLEQLDIDTTLFKRVVYDKKIYKYEEKPEAAGYDLANVFPVLNNPMKRELGFSTEPKYTRNKYLNYYNFVEGFYKNYINTTEFKKIIPLNGNGFLKVDKVAIKNTTPAVTCCFSVKAKPTKHHTSA